jgi:hypothetical protein
LGDPDGMKKREGKEEQVINEITRGQSEREMISDLIRIGDHEAIALVSSGEEEDSKR